MRTKLLLLTAVGATLAGLALAATAGAGGGKVYAPDDCTSPKVKPDRIVLTCGDGNTFINGFDWQDWGGKRSHGFGTLHANTCKPDCASGKEKDYPVAVTLKKPKPTRCVGANIYMYRKIEVDFIKREPPFASSLPTKLFCS